MKKPAVRSRGPERRRAMRRLHWAFGVYTLIALIMIAAGSPRMIGQVTALAEVARIPRAETPGQIGPGGAVIAGRLGGVIRATPLGEPALAWIASVTVTRHRGKSTVTTNRCNLVSLRGLELETSGQRLPIAPPASTSTEGDALAVLAAIPTPYLWLGARRELSPVPAQIAAICGLVPAELAHDEWQFAEQYAPPGTSVDFAGCVVDGALGPCASGPAAGHLAAGGLGHMVVRLADGFCASAALLAALLCMAVTLGSVEAMLELRSAATHSGGVL